MAVAVAVAVVMMIITLILFDEQPMILRSCIKEFIKNNHFVINRHKWNLDFSTLQGKLNWFEKL